MKQSVVISEPSNTDAPACFDLVKRVFNACVASDYSAEGIASYYDFITPQYVQNWRKENRICLVAKAGEKIVGIIDVRDGYHITMFFVDVEYQKKGIGRTLLDKAVALCRQCNPAPSVIEVHSSPFAVGIYSRLGFDKKGEEQEIKGIRFTTMELNVMGTCNQN
jgi:GNAT superfamily N-acetyltransferase